MKNVDKRYLTKEQQRITQEKGTEPQFTGNFYKKTNDGTYRCIVCQNPLFSSKNKYVSDSGWPSFDDVIKSENVVLNEDNSHGLRRIEVICAECGAHLGHVFPDGPAETTGQRYCINSSSLEFESVDGDTIELG